MNKTKSWLFNSVCTVSLSLVSLPALADQCSYISKQQAINAISRLDINEDIYFLCEPCGETTPKFAKIENLSMAKVDYQNYWQIEVNGKGIDLAYVFVDSGAENKFMNLAAIADCPADRVSPVLPETEAIEQESKEEIDL